MHTTHALTAKLADASKAPSVLQGERRDARAITVYVGTDNGMVPVLRLIGWPSVDIDALVARLKLKSITVLAR